MRAVAGGFQAAEYLLQRLVSEIGVELDFAPVFLLCLAVHGFDGMAQEDG